MSFVNFFKKNQGKKDSSVISYDDESTNDYDKVKEDKYDKKYKEDREDKKEKKYREDREDIDGYNYMLDDARYGYDD
jgi:hypothetical protein